LINFSSILYYLLAPLIVGCGFYYDIGWMTIVGSIFYCMNSVFTIYLMLNLLFVFVFVDDDHLMWFCHNNTPIIWSIQQAPMWTFLIPALPVSIWFFIEGHYIIGSLLFSTCVLKKLTQQTLHYRGRKILNQQG
jgi:hypothetical protein